jgi:putative transposase
MQPTPQGVGNRPKHAQAPEGRKKHVAYIGKHPVAFHLLDAGAQPLIKPEFRDDLFAYLGGIVREMNGTALIINGANDHVHMLIRVRPVHSAAEIARIVKTNSSRWIREKHAAHFARQTGYGVFSVSESNVDAVTKYIAVQEEHHKARSFQEEYVAFLKKNHVEYDARYIWD